MGEQLIAQLFRNIPQRTWLFKYGCVPMSFVMGEWIWEVRSLPGARPRTLALMLSPARRRGAQHEGAVQGQRDCGGDGHGAHRRGPDCPPALQRALPPGQGPFGVEKARVAADRLPARRRECAPVQRPGKCLRTGFWVLQATLMLRQVIELGLLDKWDYVLRKLFVLKAKPLKNAIR